MKLIKISAMWCPACIIMNNVWKKLEESYSDIEFVNYDYDLDEDIVKEYNPGDILPVIIGINNGKEVIRVKGEKTFNEISALIKQNR